MKIKLHQIPVRELLKNYRDLGYDGVSTTWSGKEINGEGVEINNGKEIHIDIRPEYQREFIYSAENQQKVINTVRHGYPLNVMYFNTNSNGYEVLDGQQRIISILRFINGDGINPASYTTFKFEEFGEKDEIAFNSLSENQREQILSYPLQIYICEGTIEERRKWFETINIAGEKLRHQEILNSFHTGKWLFDAKSYFSRTTGGANNFTNSKNKQGFISGDADRQDLLELALSWIADRDKKTIGEYMSLHDKDNDAKELKRYFEDVMDWIQDLFDTQHNYRKEMKGLPWGILYNKYYDKTKTWNSSLVEKEVLRLMKDEDVTNKKGIYLYILAGNFNNDLFIPDNTYENKLSIRAFDDATKRTVYERQNHQCPHCLKNGETKEYSFAEMEGDHIIPWSKGGKTVIDNCQMLCKRHNGKKLDN